MKTKEELLLLRGLIEDLDRRVSLLERTEPDPPPAEVPEPPPIPKGACVKCGHDKRAHVPVKMSRCYEEGCSCTGFDAGEKPGWKLGRLRVKL